MVQRETVGVVQLEGDIARQFIDTACQGGIKNRHADFQRFKKALFLGLEHGGESAFKTGQETQ